MKDYVTVAAHKTSVRCFKIRAGISISHRYLSDSSPFDICLDSRMHSHISQQKA